MIRGDFPWDDVGDFDSLADLLPDDTHVDSLDASGKRDADHQRSVAVLGDLDKVLTVDSSGVVAAGTDRLITILGLDDIVVVDTPDALLVTTRDRAQQVKSVVDALKESGRTELT